MLMQHNRAEEEKRESREADKQHKCKMKLMMMMTALFQLSAAAGVAAAALKAGNDELVSSPFNACLLLNEIGKYA